MTSITHTSKRGLAEIYPAAGAAGMPTMDIATTRQRKKSNVAQITHVTQQALGEGESKSCGVFQSPGLKLDVKPLYTNSSSMDRPVGKLLTLAQSKAAHAQIAKDLSGLGFPFSTDQLALICKLADEEILKPNRSTHTRNGSSIFINIAKSKCRNSAYADIPKMQMEVHPATNHVQINLKVSKSNTAVGAYKKFAKAVSIIFFNGKYQQTLLQARLSAKSQFAATVQNEASVHKELQQLADPTQPLPICQLRQVTPIYIGKDDAKCVMYLELGTGGDLFDYAQLLPSVQKHEVSSSARLTKIFPIMLDAAKAVHLLHKHGYVHADIKPENIFVVIDKMKPFIKAILGDFGKACKAKNLSIYSGTDTYIACEALKCKLGIDKQQRLGQPIDIWALGFCFYWLFIERPLPWLGLIKSIFALAPFCEQTTAASNDNNSDFKLCEIAGQINALDEIVAALPPEHLADLFYHNVKMSALKSTYQQMLSLDTILRTLMEELKIQSQLPKEMHARINELYQKMIVKLMAVFDALETMPMPDKDQQPLSTESYIKQLIWLMLRPKPETRITSQELLGALSKLISVTAIVNA